MKNENEEVRKVWQFFNEKWKIKKLRTIKLSQKIKEVEEARCYW